MSQPNAHVEARRRHIPAQLAQLCGSPPTVQPDHPDAFVQKIHSAHADVWCGAHAMCQGHRVSQRHRRGSGVVGCLALVVRRATVFQSHPYVLPEVSAASRLAQTAVPWEAAFCPVVPSPRSLFSLILKWHLA